MKKILILLAFFTLNYQVSGNPIELCAWISEIFVDNSGNWTIEIGFNEYGSEIDSIRLVTSSGSSIITNFNIEFGGNNNPFDSIALITVANLAFPVSINPEGDFVRLVSYFWYDLEDFDEVAFGNYPGSYLDCMENGESVICADWDTFCIDSSPTIGSGNDGVGYKGNFSGMIIDTAGNPITTGYIIYGNGILVLYPDEQGFFDEIIVSRRYTFDTVQHGYPPWPYNNDTYVIEPVDFCLRPDSSYHQDIICTSLVMGVEDKDDPAENVVTVAPNPFSEKITFFFNIKNTDDSEVKLSIYSLDGREIHRISISADQKRYEWAPGMAVNSGTYIYRLEKNNSIIKTGKFIRL